MQDLNKRKLDVQKQAVNSAALQDHVLKKYNLGALDPFKPKRLVN